ncbi:hypothetical protein [Streptomyces sp. CBMA156]|uniref:hypothetical protein n=1 Tax=Streptomyces sp. CBMA156 TaxID=1930280 RepID=UPI001661947D|nr:hypothetical protein [Streptomyces sp. CBMA156]MBD0675458.1 hypothetical protein [Streptomyces sp. CBMA156]
MTAQPVPLDLVAIQARCDAATPGPWWADDTEIYVGTPDDCNPDPTWIGEACNPDTVDHGLTNAQFLAHARTDVSQLFARVRDLEVELATAKAAGYRQAADHVAEMIQTHGPDFDQQMILVFLQNGASLRERFAAAQQAAPSSPTQPA